MFDIKRLNGCCELLSELLSKLLNEESKYMILTTEWKNIKECPIEELSAKYKIVPSDEIIQQRIDKLNGTGKL